MVERQVEDLRVGRSSRPLPTIRFVLILWRIVMIALHIMSAFAVAGFVKFLLLVLDK